MNSFNAAIYVDSGAYLTSCSDPYEGDVGGTLWPIIAVIGIIGWWKGIFRKDKSDRR